MPRDLLAEKGPRQPRDLLAPPEEGSVEDVKARRDKYYSSGIYAGDYNPLGAVARTIDAGARGIESGVTFGMNDEMRLTPREEKEVIREESPVASLVGEVAGGMGLGGTAAKGGLTLLQNAKPTLASLAGRGAAEGAVYGSLYGAGEAEGGLENRLLGARYGAGLGAATGGLAGALARTGLGRAKPSDAPTTEQIKSAAQKAYQIADDAGVVFRPEGLQRVTGQIKGELADLGYHPQLQPRVAATLNALDDVAGKNITLKGVDQLRKIASNARNSADASERMIGGRIAAALDDFAMNARPEEVLAGSSEKASKALRTARAGWQRAKKSELVDTAFEKAERQAASSGSGGNAENAARQKIRAILDNPSKSRGFTPVEIEAMEAFVKGTKGQNLARLIGKLSPSGSGLMAALGIGGTAANPLMAAVPATGMAAKAIANRGSKASADMIKALVRSGGKLADPTLSGGRKALADALMRAGAIEGARYIGPR